MRKTDKKLNIKKANVLVEITYLKSKGLLPENYGMCEDPLGECGMGMYEEPMYDDPSQREMEYETEMPIYEQPTGDIGQILTELEPPDFKDKPEFLRKLEMYAQGLSYRIRRESGQI